MDRTLSASFVRRQRLKYGLRVSGFAILIILGFLAFRHLLQPRITPSEFRTAVAEQGPVIAGLNASGTVIPEFEQIITSPLQATIEQVDNKAGTPIQQGSPILHLNTEFTQLAYEKLRDEHAIRKNKKAQLRLQLERTLIDLQGEYAIKKLRIEALKKNVAQETYLYKIGSAAKDQLEQARLDLEIAELQQKQLQRKLANQEATLQADLHALDLEIHIQEKSMNELQRQMELAQTRANRDGVITWVKDEIGALVQPGEEIARIADLRSFKVEATISEIHAAHLHTGGQVQVRIDTTDLTGTITTIRPTIQNGIITFIVSLKQASSPLLRSNLRVDVFVVTDYRADVIRLPNGPFFDGSPDMDVFIVRGDQAIKQAVAIGAHNFDYLEIKSGLQPGDEVIVTKMQEYLHLATIDIE